jgi:hypothetical protein
MEQAGLRDVDPVLISGHENEPAIILAAGSAISYTPIRNVPDPKYKTALARELRHGSKIFGEKRRIAA